MTAARGLVHGRRARSLVGAWVHLYTLGLPATVRGDRRDELASDLWEHATEGDGRPTVGAEIVARALLGVPADLAWRLERSRLSRLPGWLIGSLLGVFARLETAGRWVGRRGLPGITATVAIVSGLLGLLVIVTAPSNDSGASTSELVVWGSLIVIATLAIGGGGRLIDAHARLGGASVILGSVVLGLLLWPTVIGPLTGSALTWRAVVRIRQGAREPDEPGQSTG